MTAAWLGALCKDEPDPTGRIVGFAYRTDHRVPDLNIARHFDIERGAPVVVAAREEGPREIDLEAAASDHDATLILRGIAAIVNRDCHVPSDQDLTERGRVPLAHGPGLQIDRDVDRRLPERRELERAMWNEEAAPVAHAHASAHGSQGRPVRHPERQRFIEVDLPRRSTEESECFGRGRRDLGIRVRNLRSKPAVDLGRRAACDPSNDRIDRRRREKAGALACGNVKTLNAEKEIRSSTAGLQQTIGFVDHIVGGAIEDPGRRRPGRSIGVVEDDLRGRRKREPERREQCDEHLAGKRRSCVRRDQSGKTASHCGATPGACELNARCRITASFVSQSGPPDTLHTKATRASALNPTSRRSRTRRRSDGVPLLGSPSSSKAAPDPFAFPHSQASPRPFAFVPNTWNPPAFAPPGFTTKGQLSSSSRRGRPGCRAR